MGKRADDVLVTSDLIFVIEHKVGAKEYQRHAIDQVLDYALDLKNFHAGSHGLTIVPILVATQAPDNPFSVSLWEDEVVQPLLANQATLAPAINAVLIGDTPDPAKQLR